MESLVAAAESTDSAAAESSRARMLLAELGADDKIIADALAARPDLTPEQIRDTYAHFRQRIKDKRVNADAGAFYTAIRYGRLHTAPPDPERPIDPAAYATSTDDDPDSPEVESHQQRARRICPDRASGHDFQFLIRQLVEGATESEALAALADRSKRGAR